MTRHAQMLHEERPFSGTAAKTRDGYSVRTVLSAIVIQLRDHAHGSRERLVVFMHMAAQMAQAFKDRRRPH